MKNYFLFCLLFIVACTPEVLEEENMPPVNVDCDQTHTEVQTDLEDQMKATTDFAFDLFQQSMGQEPVNVI